MYPGKELLGAANARISDEANLACTNLLIKDDYLGKLKPLIK